MSHQVSTGGPELSVSPVADRQLIRSDWTPTTLAPIEGVTVKLVSNVLTDNGYLTEVWRPEWLDDAAGVGQVFQRVMLPGALSAWHVHLHTTDRLFCAIGCLKIVVVDVRSTSPTHGAIAEYRLGVARPAIISVPPGVLHGVRNIGSEAAVLINAVDVAYDYETPDHHRLPADSPDVAYRW
jgi:dTDP-4-dehydrorhamnose 3,5-epimerase